MQKLQIELISDITYIATDVGWLYIAGVMDLCGGVITGLSMSDRMTKEFVIAALEDLIEPVQRFLEQ